MVADRQQKAQVHGMLSRGGPALAVIGIHVILIYAISASMGIVPVPSIKPASKVVLITEDQPEYKPEPIIEPDIKPPMPQPVEIPQQLQIVQFDDDVPPAPADVPAAAPRTAPAVDQASNAGTSQALKTKQRVEPLYPAASRREGEEGTVRLRVLVDERGRPSEVQIGQSSGFSRLDEAAIDAVRRWRFQAATNGSTSVSAWTQVAVSFKLTEKDKR